MNLTPSEVIYNSFGKINSLKEYRDVNGDPCAACNQLTLPNMMTRVDVIVSNEFTEWDGLHGNMLCPSCSWLYSSKDIRSRRLVVKKNESKVWVEELTINSLNTLNECDSFSILAPVSGQKQIAPLMKWGCLTWDRATFAWHREHEYILNKFVTLRGYGLKDLDFLLDMIPIKVFSGKNTKDVTDIFISWGTIQDIQKRSDGMLDLMMMLSKHKLKDSP